MFQIVQGCVLCLGAVVNNVTHNYQLVKETFLKFFGKIYFHIMPITVFVVHVHYAHTNL